MKVPKPRKLPSGSWFIQLRLGGQSVPVTAPTEKACIRQAQLIKAQYLSETEHKPKPTVNDMTLGQMLDAYITSCKRNGRSPSTIRGYSIIRRNRLQPYMDTPVRSIRNWQKLYESESAEYTGKTLQNEWSLIRSAYKYSFKSQLPELETKKVEKKEHTFLEPDEIKVFVAAVKDKPAAIPALLALSSLRASEIADLKWSDIDFKRDTIRVAGAAVFDENNKLIHKVENKTDESRRFVPIFIPELRELLQSGRGDNDSYIVGVRPNTVYRQIKRVYEETSLPAVGVHGLRHSFASLCYSLDVPIKITMQIGGWDNPKTVTEIYTHLDKKNIAAQSEKLAKFYAK